MIGKMFLHGLRNIVNTEKKGLNALDTTHFNANCEIQHLIDSTV